LQDCRQLWPTIDCQCLNAVETTFHLLASQCIAMRPYHYMLMHRRTELFCHGPEKKVEVWVIQPVTDQQEAEVGEEHLHKGTISGVLGDQRAIRVESERQRRGGLAGI